jgi:hypothetical protein
VAEGPDRVALSIEELRALAGWAAACALEVLPLFEEHIPDDTRPRQAVESALEFADGGPRTTALRVHALDAYRAALEADAPAAAHAASAASAAAASAFLHPLAKATQVKHLLGSAAHAVRALEIADTAAVLEDQRRTGPTAPDVVVAVLRRYPPAPVGGGRVGELMRSLDERLRT